MTVNIMGTEYALVVKSYGSDPVFAERSLDAYCDGFTKEIVICNMRTYKGWENESDATCLACQKIATRHEIVHAFFNESGLMESAHVYGGAFSKNEELVDWIAIQGPKIYKAWEEAGAL